MYQKLRRNDHSRNVKTPSKTSQATRHGRALTMASFSSIVLPFLALLHLISTSHSLSIRKHHELNRRDALGTAAVSGLLLPTNAQASTTSLMPSTSSSVTLEGIQFPLVSFGLQIYDDEMAYKLTLTALEVGYRNFFASVLARNQRGFAKAVRDSGLDRKDLYICGSVVSNRVSGFEEAKKLTTRGWKENLNAFSAGDISYLDQIMLDYPGPDAASIQGQWRSFEEMKKQGYTKSLSVSNFSPTQLDYILKDPKAIEKPVVNQLPFSVAYHPGNAIQENSKRGVLVQAWAPLGGSLGGRFNAKIKAACSEIGSKYNKSAYQVALRWIVQSGAAVCTQSKKREHFVEDLNIFDFELSKEDMTTLDSLAG